MVNLEQRLSTEDADQAAIVRGILAVQARFAGTQQRPLGRGTHTKGTCARAELEVFDLMATIGDHALATRLAKGLFAAPGTYPATVRFANASSTVNPDAESDLRALSFSVQLPPGFSAQTTRQDFSLQNATTFPINDVHTFAVVMQVLSARGMTGTLSAFRSLPLRDKTRVVSALAIGKWQGLGKPRPYQQTRYWSTVPFRHGPFEAAKYSAIPLAANPARSLQPEPDALQNELARHLSEDEQMSAFDIGVQLLDANGMTYRGRRREVSFWIENGRVEWKEWQAPFHIVGRLTLVAKSQTEPAACDASYIDVVGHSLPDCQPVGSLNRARRASELASRQARLGLVVTPPAPSVAAPGVPLSRRLKQIAALLVGLVAVYGASAAVYAWRSTFNVPTYERVDEVRYLDQGWGSQRESADRELYYYTGQGTSLKDIRYGWFVNLERPFRRSLLTDPDYFRTLNFIVDPVATHANPDRLPVGFARRYDDTLRDFVVDITCAACHTGQLNVTSNGRRTAIRVDGGQAMHAFADVKAGAFQLELALSVTETFFNPLKFNRFARRVLGPDTNSLAGKWRLWRDLGGALQEIETSSLGSFAPWHYPVQEGYGRTDALARIANVVFGDHVDATNYHAGNAPVSYPYLWNIWKFDWVQYGASVSQPMARNVGEAMGVGAVYHFLDDYRRPIAPAERYRTSISFDNLQRIESTLQKLTPPRWPQDLLGTIDQESAARGKAIFDERCAPCHGPHVSSEPYKRAVAPGRAKDDPMWVIRPKEVSDVGTDPTAANNFFRNTVDLTRSGLTMEQVRPLLAREYQTKKMREAGQSGALTQLLSLRKTALASAQATRADPQTVKTIEAEIQEIETEIYDLEKYALTDDTIAQKLDAIDLKSVNGGVGLNMLGLMIRDRYYTDRHFSGEARACFEGFDMLDTPQVEEVYKPRPLEGVWATPPFLHNGSVPSLYELLSPANERSTRFFVGRREFDSVHVGYVTEPVSSSSGGFWFDTTLPGNRNTGHEFREGYVPYDHERPVPSGGIIGPALSHQQRMDVIEYLKIHRDAPPDEPQRTPPDCFALLK